MLLKDLLNKKVAIWGMGKEGHSIAHFLDKHNISYSTIDKENESDIFLNEVIFKSPGVSLYHPLLKEAKEKGIVITSSTNFYMENKSPLIKSIAVTGTKGKSTTSSLMAHVLRKMGYRVGFGGNIGVPLLDLWEEKIDFLVAELSSYQCADLTTGFDLTIVTNLYPEHIDWHQSHEQYFKDKLNILKVRKTGQKAVINCKNEKLMQLTDGLKDIYYFNKNISTVKSPLLGHHNQENIDAIKVALRVLDLPLDHLEDYLSDFKALPHRLEVFDVNGITYVDDSISTTPETSLAALQVFEGKNRFLLVGGYDRKQDYSKLIDYAQQQNVNLICLPDTGKAIHEKVPQSFLALDMKEAIEIVGKYVKKGDVVILSPGAPSYNCYKNFEERGRDFKKNILKV